MMAWLRTIVSVVVFTLLNGPVGAQTGVPDVNLLSDENINKAQADVMAMDEPELRAFLGYLAECNDRQTRSEVVHHACRTARVKYQTEYKRGRAVDAVVDELEKLLEVQQRIRSMGIYPKTEFVDGLDAKLREFASVALRAKRTR